MFRALQRFFGAECNRALGAGRCARWLPLRISGREYGPFECLPTYFGVRFGKKTQFELRRQTFSC